MKSDKPIDAPTHRINSKGSNNPSPASGNRSSPVVAEAGNNLMQFLQTGGSSPNSPGPVAFETAANTSGWILDLKVKVVDILGKECLQTETCINFSPSQSSIPGSSKLYTFHILKVNAIQSIVPIQVEDIVNNEAKIKVSPIDHVMLSANPAPRHINIEALTAREQKLLSEAHEASRRLNPKAPGAGQQIFTALSKTLPCAWDKNDIIVLDEVRIKPLYKVETCEAILATSQQALDRVKKVLGSERKKLSLDASPVNTPKLDQRPNSSRKDHSSKRNSGISKKDFKSKDPQKK